MPNVLRRGPTDVWRMALTPNQKELATIDETGEVAIWDVKSQTPRKTVIGKHEKVVLGFDPMLAFDASGQRLLSGGGGGEVSLWEISRRGPINTFAHLTRPYDLNGGVALGADTVALVPRNQRNTVLIIDAETTDEIGRFQADEDSFVSSVAFGDGALAVAYAHGDGLATVADIGTNDKRCTVGLSHSSISELAVDKTGSIIAGYRGDLDRDEIEINVVRCNGEHADQPILLGVNGARPTALAFAEDGETMFSGHEDGRVFAWDLKARSPTPTRVADGRSRINALEYSGRHRRLIVGTARGEILHIRRTKTDTQFMPAQQVGMQLGYVTLLTLSPDGSYRAGLDIENSLVL